jgi:hypothetical protein
MHFSPALVASFFAIGALAGPINNTGGLKRICPGLATMENGCVRCTPPLDLLASALGYQEVVQIPAALTLLALSPRSISPFRKSKMNVTASKNA